MIEKGLDTACNYGSFEANNPDVWHPVSSATRNWVHLRAIKMISNRPSVTWPQRAYTHTLRRSNSDSGSAFHQWLIYPPGSDCWQHFCKSEIQNSKPINFNQSEFNIYSMYFSIENEINRNFWKNTENRNCLNWALKHPPEPSWVSSSLTGDFRALNFQNTIFGKINILNLWTLFSKMQVFQRLKKRKWQRMTNDMMLCPAS